MNSSSYKIYLLILAGIFIVSIGLALNTVYGWLNLPYTQLETFPADQILIVFSLLLAIFSLVLFRIKPARDLLFLASAGILNAAAGQFPAAMQSYHPEVLLTAIILALVAFNGGKIISVRMRPVNIILVALLAVVLPLLLIFSTAYVQLPQSASGLSAHFFRSGASIFFLIAFVRFFIEYHRKRSSIYFWFTTASFAFFYSNALEYPYIHQFTSMPVLGAVAEIVAFLSLLIALFFENTRFLESEVDIRRSLETAYKRLGERFDRAEELLNGVDAGVLNIDPDGRVTQANRKAADILSPGKADIIGRYLDELLDAESLDKWMLEREKWKSGISTEFDVDLDSSSRAGRPFTVYAVPIHRGSKRDRGVRVVLVDASTQRKEEQQSREHESALKDEIASVQMLLKQKNDALSREKEYNANLSSWIRDVLLFIDARGNCTYINEYGRRLFGYSAKQLTRKRLPDFIRDIEALRKNYGDSMIMELKDHEADMKTKDGKRITLSWYVKYIPESDSTQEGAICLGRDISEHKQMKSRIEAFNRDFNILVEQKTAALRKRTNQLVKLLNIGEVRALDADIGDIMSDIASVIHKIGWKEVLITRRMSDNAEPGILASRGFRKGRLDSLFVKHNPLFIETVRLLTRDSKLGASYLLSTKTHGPINVSKFTKDTRWDQSTVLVTPLKIRNKIIGFIYTFQPVNGILPNDEELGFLEIFARRAAVAIENIALLSEMKERTGHLENANRVKMDYFTQMSHELRTPLNSILAITGVLMNQLAGDLNAEQHRQIHIVQNNGERLLELINDILDIAKIESGKMELRQSYFKLSEGLHAVSEMIIPLCETKNLQFDLNVTRHTPEYLFTDRDKFEQVLTNILSNAVKHTKRGKIRVLADADRKKNRLLISISDTGSGIEKRDLKAIFEPFHQSDAPDANHMKGTGLGLSISRHLWEMMDGTMAVESRKGRGTTFQLTLPLRDLDQNMPPNEQADDAADDDAVNGGGQAEGNRHLVLIVDDNKDNQYALKYILEEKGYRVLFARDGNEGVRIAKKERPALILMDMMMPGMDGYEATRKLRTQQDFEKTPIIAMTAKTKAEDDGRAIAAGCTDYLSKPFKADTVLSKIDYWLRNS